MRAGPPFWLLLGAIVGCKPQAEQQVSAENKPCVAPSDSLAAVTTLGKAQGHYRLTMMATAGKQKGAKVNGRLRLAPNDARHLYRSRLAGGRDTVTRYPFYGSADIDLTAVDAVKPGELTSFNPDLPGVLAIQSPKSVMLRLGTESNRPGVVRFDGGYTVLRVRRVQSNGFDGTWNSGASMPLAGGYFCAVKMADST
jgi:hypothetical protein